MVVQSRLLSGLWFRSYGGEFILDFSVGTDHVPAVGPLRRVPYRLRRGRRTTVRFRPDTEQDWTATRASLRCVVVEIG